MRKNDWLFCVVSLSTSNKWQMNCLPLMITSSLEWNHTELWVSHAQHLEVIHVCFGKIKIRKFEWCLYNNIDAYVCNLKIKLKLNELLCSWEIMNWHFERKECFKRASSKVLWEILTEGKTSVFVVVWCL